MNKPKKLTESSLKKLGFKKTEKGFVLKEFPDVFVRLSRAHESKENGFVILNSNGDLINQNRGSYNSVDELFSIYQVITGWYLSVSKENQEAIDTLTKIGGTWIHREIYDHMSRKIASGMDHWIERNQLEKLEIVKTEEGGKRKFRKGDVEIDGEGCYYYRDLKEAWLKQVGNLDNLDLSALEKSSVMVDYLAFKDLINKDDMYRIFNSDSDFRRRFQSFEYFTELYTDSIIKNGLLIDQLEKWDAFYRELNLVNRMLIPSLSNGQHYELDEQKALLEKALEIVNKHMESRDE